MDLALARRWIVWSSLACTAGYFAFFTLAPIVGYPLLANQAIRLLEVITPVFFGYLGSAVRFLFAQNVAPSLRTDHSGMLPILVRGPVIVFNIIVVSALIAFGVTNRRGAPAGTGMDIDTLALYFTLALALLAATTGALVEFLFAKERQAK